MERQDHPIEEALEKLCTTDTVVFGFGLTKRHPDEHYQWVSSIDSFSSSYERGWEATTVIGPPLVYPRYGDITGAWAPARSSGTKEFLELRYVNKWYVTSIDVFETYNPGHITTISARAQTAQGFKWYPIWQGEVEGTRFGKSRIFSPPLVPFPYKTDSIRLDMDCTKAKSWVEIDSVLFRGIETFEWSPEYHKYYPKSFRKAVHTLLCVNAQKGFWTREAVLVIIRYTSEDWPLQEEDIAAKLSSNPVSKSSMEPMVQTMVQSLKSLGFSEVDCVAALSATANNLEVALELLMASKEDN